MTTSTMGMAVSDFFFGGFTYIGNGDIEAERLASQGVVAVYRYLIALDMGDDNGNGAAISLCFKAHSHFHGLPTESLHRYRFNQMIEMLPVGFGWGDAHLQMLTDAFAIER